MYLKKQSFFVLGVSKSGRAATEFLLKRGAKVYIYDDVEGRAEEEIKRLEEKGAIRVLKDELSNIQQRVDALVLSPGIPIDHPVSVAFRKAKKAVLGETELAARFMRSTLIAVTGTNGKTTTVSMIESVLKEDGKDAFACGNIGAPILDFVEKGEESFAVAEISSFQLETLNSHRPHIGVILNVTEDHLNRHYNMDNYLFLKGKLLKNTTECEFAVLNYDDLLVRSFKETTKAKCVFFSRTQKVDGAYFKDGDLYFSEEKILSADQLLIGGVHNVENALATIAVCKILGVATETIAKALTSFKGIHHRMETVDLIDGVKYVNDSKATNVDASLKAIACMTSPTIILLGGKDKGYDYDKLFSVLKNSSVIHAVLYGENRFRLLESAARNGYSKISLCQSFQVAVEVAKLTARGGQVVLLSPASASFDEFNSYEERGEKFKQIVMGESAKKEVAPKQISIPIESLNEEIE